MPYFVICSLIFYAVEKVLDIIHWDQVVGSKDNSDVSKMRPLKLDAIPKRDQVTWRNAKIPQLSRVGISATFVVTRFIWQYCSRKKYRGLASLVSVVIIISLSVILLSVARVK